MLLELQVGGLTALAGEKKSGFVAVPDTSVTMPVTIICGEKPGKTVLISGGIHSAEYGGIQTAIEIADEIEPSELAGNLIVIRLVNRSGFEHRTMSVVYEDGKNLNRVFPGDPDGTVADKIAHTIVSQFQRLADFYIDLHGGDGYEKLTPYVYCVGAAAPAVAATAKSMAEVVDVPYLVQSQSGSGGSYNYAGATGIPSILIERGCMGAWSREEVELGKTDVRNVLRHLQVLAGTVSARRFKPMDVGEVIYVGAKDTGCWYPRKKAGDTFQQGEVLGEIKDYFGSVLEVYRAEKSGVMLYQVGSLCVIKGDPLMAYGGKSI